jgi:hypothetical protein
MVGAKRPQNSARIFRAAHKSLLRSAYGNIGPRALQCSRTEDATAVPTELTSLAPRLPRAERSGMAPPYRVSGRGSRGEGMTPLRPWPQSLPRKGRSGPPQQSRPAPGPPLRREDIFGHTPPPLHRGSWWRWWRFSCSRTYRRSRPPLRASRPARQLRRYRAMARVHPRGRTPAPRPSTRLLE